MKNTYYTYITTNPNRTVLYIGRTEDLSQRIIEHWLNRGKPDTFAGKYYCYNLIYFEESNYVNDSIEREKQLKGWSRKKKDALIAGTNPNWIFLNNEFVSWPPKEAIHRKDLIEGR